MSEEPRAGTSFTDHSAGLVNGRPQTYGIAALFKGAGPGKIVEGPLVTLQASPVVLPSGFLSSSINEGERSGSVRFHAATGEIALSGSGKDIQNTDDGGYFLSRPISGDFEITVQANTRPTATNEWAKAGLMVRESLDAGARNVYLATTPIHGLQRQWRASADGDTNWGEVISPVALTLPITLRLTRRGDTITAEYSRDNGRSFQAAGQPLSFDPPLAHTAYAGLAITAHDEREVSEAKFRGLEIRKP